MRHSTHWSPRLDPVSRRCAAQIRGGLRTEFRELFPAGVALDTETLDGAEGMRALDHEVLARSLPTATACLEQGSSSVRLDNRWITPIFRGGALECCSSAPSTRSQPRPSGGSTPCDGGRSRTTMPDLSPVDIEQKLADPRTYEDSILKIFGKKRLRGMAFGDAEDGVTYFSTVSGRRGPRQSHRANSRRRPIQDAGRRTLDLETKGKRRPRTHPNTSIMSSVPLSRAS